MDRNGQSTPNISTLTAVALRKESVDRNREINTRGSEKMKVALRKESVDRNKQAQQDIALDNGSLSARRAWIEIPLLMLRLKLVLRRSPQGERG